MPSAVFLLLKTNSFLGVLQLESGIVEKVVVVIDLSRYSDICKELEQQLDVTAVAAVNDQVKSLIRLALAAAKIPSEEVPCKGTGDGAILALNSPAEASVFAEKLHKLAETHNRGKDVALAQRHFRVGIWSGKIAVQPEPHANGFPTTFDFAGTAIANAVRLEGACSTGEVLIGFDAWADLPKATRALYGPEEIVNGKRNEEFRAHRRRVVSPAGWDVLASSAANSTAGVVARQNELIATHRRRLEILEKQAAMFGIQAPPHITIEIEDIKRIIRDLEA